VWANAYGAANITIGMQAVVVLVVVVAATAGTAVHGGPHRRTRLRAGVRDVHLDWQAADATAQAPSRRRRKTRGKAFSTFL